jgi:hypothetical protein
MIKGINKTAEEHKYRSIPLDSSSSLKDFSFDRRKYYKKHILCEEVYEKENLATKMGKLVETLLLEPEEFDNRFYMSSCATMPTGLMLEFVEALYKITAEATDGFGVITRDFNDIMEEAYLASGYKINKDLVIKKFIGSDAEIYYKEIREVRSKKLIVVTVQEVTNAEKIVEELQVNEFTKAIINQVTDSRYTVINQLKVDSYKVDGHEFKSMIDKVIIDHDKKVINIYDLKCVWSVEDFYHEYYLYRRAYIQAYLYKKALEWLTRDKESNYFGYTVINLKFIVCDSINYFNPLIYILSDKDMDEGYDGFTHNGKQYPGVKSLIKELSWALDNDIWTISKKNYESNGLVKIKS